MTRLLLAVQLAVILVLSSQMLLAQEPVQAVRVFVDCSGGCDLDYFQREITFVSYVRDREDADVHVLITNQTTGGGGTQYTLRFIGRRAFTGTDTQLQYTASQTDAPGEEREGLRRTLAVGLLPYVARTATIRDIDVVYRRPSAGDGGLPVRTDREVDPWSQWVFSSSLAGSFRNEQRSDFVSVSLQQSASRVTERRKLSIELSGDYSQSEFRLSNRPPITSISRSYEAGGLYVESLGPHWSAGVQTSAQSSSFENYDLALRVGPAVEFNVFPYNESTNRELRFLYSTGVRALNYEEETLFLKTSETVFDQRLSVNWYVTEAWGVGRLSLEASHLWSDLEKNQLALFGRLNLRVVRGLSLRVSGSASRIRDQINLPRGDATDQEILLRQRELQTSFRVLGSLGLSYTFGSVFSRVVNPRFGT